MTYEEYDEMMDEYHEIERKYRKIEKKREAYLSNALKEFLDKDPDDEARKVAYNIFQYAICQSTTGNSIEWVKTKEMADKVHDILCDELMDYMLDEPEVYEDNGGYSVDCMFGGNYCLIWED